VNSAKFDFIVVNYANGDMVGHTGVMEAAVQAAQAVDTCIGRLADCVIKMGGVLMITADHGNAELMMDGGAGQPHTAHTLSPVPLILINAPATAGKLNLGALGDVAPTLLELMGLEQPAQMTGRSLIRGHE
ncbi:MAG: alkaline phosphatase family protein, partial [Rhodospirillales bacterium]|nr:alkaline phosphatase family protein [Rhodospirillales bacterium]